MSGQVATIHEAAPVATAEVPTLWDAVQALREAGGPDAHGDGVGFNGSDTIYVRDLLNRRATPSDWTGQERHKVYNLLRKYTRQLAGLGISYAAIPPVGRPEQQERAAIERRPYVVRYATERNRFILDFPFDAAVVNAVKLIPEHQFDSAARVWSVPANPNTAQSIIELTKQYPSFSFDFDIDGLLDRWRVKGTISYSNGYFVVQSRFNRELVEELRLQANATYLEESRSWGVKLTPENARFLAGIATRYGLIPDNMAVSRFEWATTAAPERLGELVEQFRAEEQRIASLVNTPGERAFTPLLYADSALDFSQHDHFWVQPEGLSVGSAIVNEPAIGTFLFVDALSDRRMVLVYQLRMSEYSDYYDSHEDVLFTPVAVLALDDRVSLRRAAVKLRQSQETIAREIERQRRVLVDTGGDADFRRPRGLEPLSSADRRRRSHAWGRYVDFKRREFDLKCILERVERELAA